MSSQLNISMLGEFSIANQDIVISTQSNRSKKIWSFLGYLILNRGTAIPCSQLIDVFWVEGKSKDPINALKVLVHRTRMMLSKLNLENASQLILYSNGTYCWNPNIPCIVDIDLFEEACKMAEEATTTEEKFTHLMKAIVLYRGEFLNGSTSANWIICTNNYFTTKFLKICSEAAALLFAEKKYDTLIDVCGKALAYVPYDESFYIYLLKALVQTNQTQKALRQYQKISDLFFKEFGITPSGELTAIYKELIQTSRPSEMSLDAIKEQMEESNISTALFCEFEFFKTFYQQKARSISRTGESVYFALLSVLNSNGTELPNQKIINMVMDSLHFTIAHNLRRGDIFTRFSLNQFLIMLPGTTYETSHLVMQRLLNTYRKEFPNISVILKYATQPITPAELRSKS